MRYASLATAAALLFSAGVAMAGTKVQGNIVDVDVVLGDSSGVSAKSKYQLKGDGSYKVQLKGMTDNAGAPAAVTTGPVDEYIAVISGDAGGGITWNYNIRVPITKEGQAKVQGSVSLISSVPVGSAVGVLGVKVYEAPTPGTAAACTTVMTDPMLPGVWLDIMGANPCASGDRVGISGVVTEAP